MLRFFNSLLFLAAIFGAVLAWSSGVEHRRVLTEHQALAAEVGIVSAEDQDKIHFMRIDTGDPLHFAWQVFMPGKHTYEWRRAYHRGGGASSSRFSEDRRVIMRVRFRKIGDQWHQWIYRGSGSSLRSLGRAGDGMFDDLDQWQFDIGGSDRPTLHDPHTAVLRLLTINRTQPSNKSDPPFLQLYFGTDEAFTAARAEAEAAKE